MTLFGFVLGVLSLGMSSSQSYPAPYPREGAVKVLENDRVVVWDVTWEKGRRTPIHQHRRNVVSVTLVPGTVKSILPDGTVRTGEPESTGDVLYGGEGLIHQKEHRLDALPRPEGVAPGWPRQGARQILDNESVVVWDYEFRADRDVPALPLSLMEAGSKDAMAAPTGMAFPLALQSRTLGGYLAGEERKER